MMASSLAGPLSRDLQDGERGRVEVEDGGGRDEVEKGLAAGFEGVELALGEEGGVGGGVHDMTVGVCGVGGQSGQ